jgi:hypothetical protein
LGLSGEHLVSESGEIQAINRLVVRWLELAQVYRFLRLAAFQVGQIADPFFLGQ